MAKGSLRRSTPSLMTTTKNERFSQGPTNYWKLLIDNNRFNSEKNVDEENLLTMLPTIDFHDTFISIEHLKNSFPGNKLIIKKSKEDEMIDPGFKLTFLDLLPISEQKKLQEEAVDEEDGIINDKIKVEIYERYNKLEENKKRNKIKFTPKQIEAIKSGIEPGLTVIVGPPGTGKTDVAVQIISNIYHNWPEQRTLVVTYSNQALNQLFEKIINLDIDQRHLLRLSENENQKTNNEFKTPIEAKIVCMASIHTESRQKEFVNLGFMYDNIVMAEAGEILEIEKFISMLLQDPNDDKNRLKRWIMYGDHQELITIIQDVSLQKKLMKLDNHGFAKSALYNSRCCELSSPNNSRQLSEFVYNYQLLAASQSNSIKQMNKDVIDELLELCSWYDATEEDDDDKYDLFNDDKLDGYGDSDEEDEIIKRLCQNTQPKKQQQNMYSTTYKSVVTTTVNTVEQPPTKLIKRETSFSFSLSSLKLNSVIMKSPSPCKQQISPKITQISKEASDFWDNLNDVEF